eukprot:283392-Prorocentrum_minimum.AAC.1
MLAATSASWKPPLAPLGKLSYILGVGLRFRFALRKPFLPHAGSVALNDPQQRAHSTPSTERC